MRVCLLRAEPAEPGDASAAPACLVGPFHSPGIHLSLPPSGMGIFGWLDKAGDVICVVSLLTVLSGACTEIHKILAWPDLSSAASQTNP